MEPNREGCPSRDSGGGTRSFRILSFLRSRGGRCLEARCHWRGKRGRLAGLDASVELVGRRQGDPIQELWRLQDGALSEGSEEGPRLRDCVRGGRRGVLYKDHLDLISSHWP